MDFHYKKKLCVLLIIFLFLLALLPALFFRRKQPEGEYITVKEVQVLAQLLQQVTENGKTKEWKEAADKVRELSLGWEDGNLTYEKFEEWKRSFKDLEGIELNFENHYSSSFYLLKEDWYLFFDQICEQLDPEKLILTEEILILGDSEQVRDREGRPIGQGQLLSHKGIWENRLPFSQELVQRKGIYLTYDNTLWGLKQTSKPAELKNVWIIESLDKVVYFYQNYEVTSLPIDWEASGREQVADLTFMEGRLKAVKEKTERISGEVLKLSEKEIEIKGKGIYPFSEEIQFYRLYDSLETVGRNLVRIGYSFVDFVVEDGEIQAGLLVRDEQMETIRVLLKTSDFDGYYHKEVEMVSDVELTLSYGEKSLILPAKEPFSLNADSEYFKEGRIFIEPGALTGRTCFPSISRSVKEQGYHGSFELEKREEGILIINKVLLEEYLYAVVPSEMPASYPMEALKAQAICARTYAYDKMLNSSLSSLGAHLDDSSTFQVYNNIQENTNTTRAVKETRGLLLYNQGELAKTYYYSTSGGFGTNDAIWNREGNSQLPYLQAREMTEEEAEFTERELMEEESFREFVDDIHPSHFEAKEAWYRWTYEHDHIDYLWENLKKRQESYPNAVLISTDGTNFTMGELPDEMALKDIQVKKRGAGGTVEELLFVGEKMQVLVQKELHVRAVLTDGESRVVLQDGKTYACRNLLPSAFYYLILQKEEGRITSLKLKGGGFGHGVGMSQNGARNLAVRGRTYEDILTFYYAGCQVRKP